MNLAFVKYQGAGNDFIIMDNRTLAYSSLTKKIISRLCHRRFGIGADGLILLNASSDYDFEMSYYNADGEEGSMCGNGARCVVDFAKQLGLFENQCIFMASDGTHKAKWSKEEVVLQMSDVIDIEQGEGYYFLDTGSPHYVKWVDDLDSMDVRRSGRKIRYNQRFNDHGTNVNFISLRGEVLFLRTYERGVEDETLACGTGAVASAIVAHASGNVTSNQLKVNTLGGTLTVSFQKTHIYQHLSLSGPYQRVFEGNVNFKKIIL